LGNNTSVSIFVISTNNTLNLNDAVHNPSGHI
jgi:hypothetical protein